MNNKTFLWVALLLVLIGSASAALLNGSAASGVGSLNWTTLFNNMSAAQQASGNVTRIVGGALVTPWYSSSTACQVSDLQSGGNCNIGTVNRTQYCMVSDEHSVKGMEFAMSTDAADMDAWYNALPLMKVGKGSLPGWRCIVNESSSTINCTDSRVNNNDTASDATARYIEALFIAANNTAFTAGNRSKYLSLAINMSQDTLTYEYDTTCRNSSLGYGNICYWPASGSNAKMGGLGSTDYFYSGYAGDLANSMLFAWTATGNQTYLNVARNVSLNYLQAAYPNTTSLSSNGFRVPPGKNFHWVNLTTQPAAVCDDTCGPDSWDGVDAPRAFFLCEFSYLANQSNNSMPSLLGQYCANWTGTYMKQYNSLPIQYYSNGTPSAANYSGYWGQGLQADALLSTLNASWVNATLTNAASHYREDLGLWDWNGTAPICTGIYQEQSTQRAIGAAIGLMDGAAGINVGSGGGGSGGNSSGATTWCYQETANVATACGGLATGSYGFDGAWASYTDGTPIALYDGDWSTYDVAVPGPPNWADMVINYTRPTAGLSVLGVTWTVKDAGGTANITLPALCWNNPAVMLKGYSNRYANDSWYCWYNATWNLLRNDNATSGAIYEEGIWWNVTATNITLNAGNGFDSSNGSLENQFNNNFSINYTVAAGFNFTVHVVNITNGGVIYFNESDAVNTGSYTWNRTLNTTAWPAGRYTINISTNYSSYSYSWYRGNASANNPLGFVNGTSVLTLGVSHDSSISAVGAGLVYNGAVQSVFGVDNGTSVNFNSSVSVPNNVTIPFSWTVNVTEVNGYSYLFVLNYTQNITTSTFNVSYFDASTGAKVLSSVTAQLSSNVSQLTNVSSSGYGLFTGIGVGQYNLLLTAAGYTSQSYLVSIAGTSNLTSLNAYLFNASMNTSSVIINVLDAGANGAPLAGASVVEEQFVNGSLVAVSNGLSDVTGKISFSFSAGVKYVFLVSKAGYVSQTFTLFPILYSSYNVNLARSSSDVQSYGDVNVYWQPAAFYNNQSNNFTLIISSGAGTLVSYSYGVSYPGGTCSGAGANVVGQGFNCVFSMVGATLGNSVVVNYTYSDSFGRVVSGGGVYAVLGNWGVGTLAQMQGNTYGMSLFERLLVATLITVALAGLVTLAAGSLVGVVFGLFIYGVFIVLGFIPAYAAVFVIIVGFFIVSRRSGEGYG